jgi:hypothetical protein
MENGQINLKAVSMSAMIWASNSWMDNVDTSKNNRDLKK